MTFKLLKKEINIVDIIILLNSVEIMPEIEIWDLLK